MTAVWSPRPEDVEEEVTRRRQEAPARKRRERINAIVTILVILAAWFFVAVMVWDDWSPSAPSASAEPSETSESSVVEVETSPGTSGDGFAGARDDVEDFSCSAGSGEWSVVGTVTNPLQETVDYRIYTSFRDSERDRALIQIDVTEVEPGETREWDGSVAVVADDLRCILRVERTVAGS